MMKKLGVFMHGLAPFGCSRCAELFAKTHDMRDRCASLPIVVPAKASGLQRFFDPTGGRWKLHRDLQLNGHSLVIAR